MAYLPNIPQGTDFIRNSRAQILGNFQDISSLVNVNHVDFDLPDAGKHKWVTFPTQATTPNPPFFSDEIALFNLLDPLTNAQDLFVVNPSSFTFPTFSVPVTSSVLSYSTPDNGSSGWTMLPSGIILKWGYRVTVAITTGSGSFVFPTSANIPVFNKCFTVIPGGTYQVGVSAVPEVIGNLDNLGFDITIDVTATQNIEFSYLAIGF